VNRNGPGSHSAENFTNLIHSIIVTVGPVAPEKVPQSENRLPVARASSVVVKISQTKVRRSAHAHYNLPFHDLILVAAGVPAGRIRRNPGGHRPPYRLRQPQIAGEAIYS
jgi:hypothetical protein